MSAGPLPSAFERYDTLQDQHRMWRVEEPAGSYWLCLDRELIVQGLQDTETFSSSAIVVLDPEPVIRMKPIQLDPPEHSKWRKMLASYFSVKRMPHLENRIRERVTELLDEVLPKGECDFVTDIAMRFPSVIFLEIIGLPTDELETFLEWEAAALHSDPDTPDREAQFGVLMQVMARFQQAIDERRARPDSEATDIISHAVAWEIDGQPVRDADILECCLLLFLAGLDTVTNELSYAIWHLSTHERDRSALRDNPPLIPQATEELLRTFSIPQLARKVTHDTTFGSQDLKTGDMVLFSLAAANRDPEAIQRAREVIFEREATPHYAFGAGPHRCLGSHLARQEINIFLAEWCARVPNYELATREEIIEHRGSVHGIAHLPVQWNTSA
ncbi:MAG TPA: cytochrome P450 [Acidimicrobiales bacterium]|jgi:cytochrome P450